MGTWLLVGLFCAAPFVLPAQRQPTLVGEWAGEVGETRIRLHLEPAGGCVLERRGDTGELEVSFGNYRYDASKRPRTLRLGGLTGHEHPLHLLLRFEGPDALQVSYASPRWRLRPLGFDEGQTLTLRRQD